LHNITEEIAHIH